MAEWMAIEMVELTLTERDWVQLKAEWMAISEESRLGCSMAGWMAIEMVELTARDLVQLRAQWMVRGKARQLHHMPSL